MPADSNVGAIHQLRIPLTKQKIEELVERSQGDIRADVVHRLYIVPMGFGGDERTTRRAVARAKDRYRAGHRRTYRPRIAEPGMWAQFDWGAGPSVAGRTTCLFCAWLAWSRFRVVIPTWDKTLPTLLACIDTMLRRFGAAPTYLSTDNERTVTADRVAGRAVRHPLMVAAGRHYGCAVPLWLRGRDMCSIRFQGRLGGDGARGQSRPGAHRRQPGGRLRGLRRFGGRLCGLREARQRPAPCRDPDGPKACVGPHRSRAQAPGWRPYSTQ